jgi:hypothetical protein
MTGAVLIYLQALPLMYWPGRTEEINKTLIHDTVGSVGHEL